MSGDVENTYPYFIETRYLPGEARVTFEMGSRSESESE